MKLLASLLTTVVIASPFEIGREVLFEDSSTLVMLHQAPNTETPAKDMVLARSSEDQRGKLVLTCNDGKYLRAKIVSTALGFSEAKKSQVLSYRIDGEITKRIHGEVHPIGDLSVAYFPDPDFLRAVKKSNTKFFQSISGRSRLEASFKVGVHTVHHAFRLDDINYWILKLAERCGRDLSVR